MPLQQNREEVGENTHTHILPLSASIPEEHPNCSPLQRGPMPELSTLTRPAASPEGQAVQAGQTRAASLPGAGGEEGKG